MYLIEGEKMKISLKRKINALLGTFIIAGTMSGCRVKCDIEKEHRHLYKNSSGYTAYVDSEENMIYGFTRYDDYIDGAENPVDDYAFKHELLRIDDNIDLINNKQDSDCDYTLYQWYLWTGKYFTYGWTENENSQSLTGIKRNIHHMYKAYKIIEKDGEYEIISSDLVDDLNLIKDEYPYIEVEFVHLINMENGKDLGTEGVDISSYLSHNDEKTYKK